MKFKTSISKREGEELFVRGKKLTDMIGAMTFTEAVFFILKGELPNKHQTALLDAVLVATVEHGIEVPSAFVPRVVASTGNSVNAALAAGALTIGTLHGGAIEQCAQILQSGKSAKEIVGEALAKKERISGYGHKVYKDADPRTTAIYAVAEKQEVDGKYLQLTRDIEKELALQSGKQLPLNIDGAIAAVISELGIDWRLGKAFFILGRMPGMMAHILEEMINEKSYRRLEKEEVEYIGTP